jgi:hypothetical protein
MLIGAGGVGNLRTDKETEWLLPRRLSLKQFFTTHW